MNAQLQILFDKLEKDRVLLLREIADIPSAQFHSAPQGKWSIEQILAHLITGERMTLGYMQKKILAIAETEKTGVAEEIKMILLILSQRLPFKFRAPGAVIKLTPSYHDAAALTSDWKNLREELREFLESLNDDQVKRKIYKHIRAGRMNPKHGIKFLREHFHHHLPQVKRLL